MENKLDNKQIITSDLTLAASLVSLGFEIQSLERSNPQKVLFMFAYNTKTIAAINKYWNGKLLIDALKLGNNIRNLKTLIHSA